jgi:uncharacterized membrane protein YeaQ/YmgE (transglycosylase-associated protein family)
MSSIGWLIIRADGAIAFLIICRRMRCHRRSPHSICRARKLANLDVQARISAVLKIAEVRKEDFMHISNESLVLILVVGVAAGWLAGQLVRGTGFGLIGDLIIGVIGAFIGTWLLPRLNIHIGSGVVGAIVTATIGAALLLVILRVFRKRGSW